MYKLVNFIKVSLKKLKIKVVEGINGSMQFKNTKNFNKK